MTPSGLDRRRVRQLLASAKHNSCVGSRIETFSGLFVGCPYKPFPLIGSASTPEVFAAPLDAFDCVTYIETVLALARAKTVNGFIIELRKIRYQGGRVEWKKRNHYMTGWIRNNQRGGIVRRVAAASVPTVLRRRVLNVVPGLPVLRARIRCVPKNALPRLAPHLAAGDLVFFASTRKNLDFFHAGIIARTGERLLLRHASRSQSGVVEQALDDFLKMNRMAGIVAVRPS